MNCLQIVDFKEAMWNHIYAEAKKRFDKDDFMGQSVADLADAKWKAQFADMREKLKANSDDFTIMLATLGSSSSDFDMMSKLGLTLCTKEEKINASVALTTGAAISRKDS